mgnify:CR=1 FL=1
MKIFIAGGTGAIGSYAVRALVQAGHEVTSTARTAAKAEQLKQDGARGLNVDVYDSAALRSTIHNSDVVIRLTTRIPPLSKMSKLSSWKETNHLRMEGATALVDACIAERIPIYVSESIGFLYADSGSEWINEQSAIDDEHHHPILAAALESEHQAQRVVEYGGKPVVLRFGALYGPHDTTTRQMALWIRRWMMPRIGSARNYMSALFLEDAGSAVAASLSAPAGVYNIVDNEPVTLRDYLTTMARALHAPRPMPIPGVLGPILFGAPWRYFSRSLRLSNARFREATGWNPATGNTRDGWQRIVSELSKPA